MQRTITVNSNELAKSIETKHLLEQILIENGFNISSKIESNTELIISIGGDGSFLKTVHDMHFPQIPILGVNTGHLGFFTEINPDQINYFVENYKNGKFINQTISPLEAHVTTKTSSFRKLAINEVVVKSDKSRVIHLTLTFDNRRIQKFSGDGLIISTSTGSTAYNYSAGGSIVDTSLEVLQVTPLQPINTNAFRCFTSSIIASKDSIITISPEINFENSTLVVIDGVEYKFEDIDTIELKLSNKNIHVLRMEHYEFWKMVSKKFL
ncbi:MAG: NAD(+)/NADH kinase [Clostridioides sp.]|jgi:NAD+ kinase|nr:NAD(+)/NADH kinase [Clostridioides sp.]